MEMLEGEKNQKMLDERRVAPAMWPYLKCVIPQPSFGVRTNLPHPVMYHGRLSCKTKLSRPSKINYRGIHAPEARVVVGGVKSLQ